MSTNFVVLLDGQSPQRPICAGNSRRLLHAD